MNHIFPYSTAFTLSQLVIITDRILRIIKVPMKRKFLLHYVKELFKL